MNAREAGQSERGRHTLVVSYEPVPPECVGEMEPDDDELLQAELECGGVTDYCRTWWECTEPHVVLLKGWSLIDLVYEGRDLWHGVEHQVIDGLVMVPSEQCISTTFDSAQEAIQEAAQGRAPGRWSADIYSEGNEYTRVDILAPVAFITDRVLARAAYEARKLVERQHAHHPKCPVHPWTCDCRCDCGAYIAAGL